MTDHQNHPSADEPHFGIVSASDHRVRRPMADLAEVSRTMAEIEARSSGGDPLADLAVAEIDHDLIWANYRRGKGTPTTASTLAPQAVDRAEVERRLNR